MIRKNTVRKGGGWFVEAADGRVVLVLVRPGGELGASIEMEASEANELASTLRART